VNSNACTTDLPAWKHEWRKYPWAVQSRPGSWCGQLLSPCQPAQWTWRRCLSSRHSPHTASDPLGAEAVMITQSSGLFLQRNHHIIVLAIKLTTQSLLRATWQTTLSTFNKKSSEIMAKYSMLVATVTHRHLPKISSFNCDTNLSMEYVLLSLRQI